MTVAGNRFENLVTINPQSASLVRCRFGSHDPVPGKLISEVSGGLTLWYITCASSNSEDFGRTSTGYEFVSVSINEQNFLPSLAFCAANSDSCAKFR